MTALCAVLASGVYCLIVLGFGVRTFALAHAVGFISSVLFLVPGFPLVAALLDLTQQQTTAGIARLFYGLLLTLAAAVGLSLVAAIANLTPAPAAAAGQGIEPMTLLWRAVACFAGGCGYGILFNNPLRTIVIVGALSMLGNELRLALHDLGGPRLGRRFSAHSPSDCSRPWCASRCTCRASRSPFRASS